FTAFYILKADDLKKLAPDCPAVAEFLQTFPALPDKEAELVTVHLSPQPGDAPTVGPAASPRSPKHQVLPAAPRPTLVPADAPADVDYVTLRAGMKQGELFGERS